MTWPRSKKARREHIKKVQHDRFEMRRAVIEKYKLKGSPRKPEKEVKNRKNI